MTQEYRFRVNLLHDGNTLQDAEQLLTTARNKTLYLPVSIAGSLPMKALKHGDVFTVSGLLGVRLKRLVESSRILHIEIDSDPEEVLTGNLVGMNRYGLYSMSLSDSSVALGGQIYNFAEEGFPVDVENDAIYEITMASDGEYSYILFELESAVYTLVKIDSSGNATTLETDLESLSDLDCMTYVGDDKLAILADRYYILISITDGEVLVNRFSEAFTTCESFVYFQETLYGFGYGNVLYTIDKNTGIVVGEGVEEDKKSNTLSWVEGSSATPEIQYMHMPFVYNNRLYAIVFAEDKDLIVEVFPETNEVNFISLFKGVDELYGICELNISGDETDEIGLSSASYYDFYSYYYNGEAWVDADFFLVTPTESNLILQWADRTEWDNGAGDPEWTDLEFTNLTLIEDYYWEFDYSNPSESYVLRMRYVDGEFWHYFGED